MRKKNIQKSNQKSKKRKLLVATLALAALIVGGSTFAWFTSKDEVTNRLTASADYGVAIAEDFTPPENWIPGQEIEKNVSVVNTGNVDAFVRVWLEGEFDLVKEGDGITYNATYAPTTITNNDKLVNLGFVNVNDGSADHIIKPLSKDKTLNPANSGDPNNTSNSESYSEVQALQAGGYLAYAPSGAQYKYTTNQNKNIIVYKDSTNCVPTDVPFGSVIHVNGTAAAPSNGTYIAPANTAGDINSDTFLPMTTGLYLFRRNMDVNNAVVDQNWEYSGYYYVAKSGDTGGEGEYYALKTKTDTSDNDTVYVDGIAYNDGGATPTWYVNQQTGAIDDTTALANVKLFEVVETTVNDDNISWVYTAAAGTDPAKLTATIHTDGGNTVADQISIDVLLANIDGISSPNESWQYVAATAGKRATFYYKDDVEQGDTTAKLVDAVTLSDKTKQTAYIAFDFDLNVNMDSVQVTVDDNENENFASVNAWQSTSKAVAQRAIGTAGKEINYITWAAS